MCLQSVLWWNLGSRLLLLFIKWVWQKAWQRSETRTTLWCLWNQSSFNVCWQTAITTYFHLLLRCKSASFPEWLFPSKSFFNKVLFGKFNSARKDKSMHRNIWLEHIVLYYERWKCRASDISTRWSSRSLCPTAGFFFAFKSCREWWQNLCSSWQNIQHVYPRILPVR